ncbi:hypothetical protein GGR54DRAFT_455895 [Hypoxylon sp. NC1633]|nr:hypothetical protein GGR54DRAFT_455895 [Hypoxylon sp. NC1633]
MAYHYDTRHRTQDLTRDWADRASRDARHGGQPMQYIVNAGRMTIDERTLRRTSTIIYNAPGSSLRITPSAKASISATVQRNPNPNPNPHHHHSPAQWWTTAAAAAPVATHTCRGCYERRELYYGGYCHECAALRAVYPREAIAHAHAHRRRDRDDRHLTHAPERRLLAWH